ncbi:hypothetical protein NEIRO03_0651 [Nematocida sp. AWRm78]|nr:hypothetical protein NEIRO02_0888 [Nematocida sp. AWRm79]KAI5183024.1 hypothetical protein NEIRO03_0651 [Nematocida sp. AWRm78]
MKGKLRHNGIRREDSAHRKISYDNFMTQKEKDFVAFLFERTLKKKERVCPDFYTKERVPRPEIRKKEASEEERLFEGVLGMAIRKSTKKTITTKDEGENSQVFIKKLISRGKIEEIYDILNISELFIDEPASTDDKDADSIGTNKVDTEAIIEKLKEIGEDLFNMDKGIELVDKLLFTRPEERKQYSSTIISILIDRIRYIYYTSDLCDYVSKLVPIIKETLPSLTLKPEVLASLFISNTTGILIGHILLVMFKKENPDLFFGICKLIPGLLTPGCISRMFLKIPHPLIWRFLAVCSKKMPFSELVDLRKRLDSYIIAGLKKKSPVLVDNIRIFLKRCP